MGRARFVFNVTCLSRDVPAPGGSVGPLICWRLLSANNRQLGRSAGVFDDLASSRRAVEELVASLSLMEPLLTRQRLPSGWLWRIVAGNQVVATSGRSFETKRQALRTMNNFLAAAALAAITADLMNPPPSRKEPLDEMITAGDVSFLVAQRRGSEDTVPGRG